MAGQRKLLKNPWFIAFVSNVVVYVVVYFLTKRPLWALVAAILCVCAIGLDTLARHLEHRWRRRVRRFSGTGSASVVVFDRTMSRILLVERSPDSDLYPGALGLPGGHLAPKESPRNAALRELHEETGIQARSALYVNVYRDEPNMIFMFVFTLRLRDDLLEPRGCAWKDARNLNAASLSLAPNTPEAVTESRRTLDTAGLTSTIEHVSSRAISNLLDNIQEVGDRVGWGHQLFAPDLGVMNTNIGLLAVANSPEGYRRGVIQRVASTVRTKNGHADGGWGKSSTDAEAASSGGLSVAESTAFAVLALVACGYGKEDETVARGVMWLRSNSHPDGSIGVNIHGPAKRVFATCMKVLALHAVDPNDDQIPKSVHWLCSARHDCGWAKGDISNLTRSPSIPVTALVYYVLSATGHIAKLDRPDETRTFLLGRVGDGAHIQDDEDLCYGYTATDPAPYDIEIKYDSRALLLLAVSSMSHYITRAELQLARAILERFDDDRNWTHSLMEGHSPVWATYWNLLALKMVRLKAAALSHVDVVKAPKT